MPRNPTDSLFKASTILESTAIMRTTAERTKKRNGRSNNIGGPNQRLGNRIKTQMNGRAKETKQPQKKGRRYRSKSGKKKEREKKQDEKYFFCEKILIIT